MPVEREIFNVYDVFEIYDHRPTINCFKEPVGPRVEYNISSERLNYRKIVRQQFVCT